MDGIFLFAACVLFYLLQRAIRVLIGGAANKNRSNVSDLVAFAIRG